MRNCPLFTCASRSVEGPARVFVKAPCACSERHRWRRPTDQHAHNHSRKKKKIIKKKKTRNVVGSVVSCSTPPPLFPPTLDLLPARNKGLFSNRKWLAGQTRRFQYKRRGIRINVNRVFFGWSARACVLLLVVVFNKHVCFCLYKMASETCVI